MSKHEEDEQGVNHHPQIKVERDNTPMEEDYYVDRDVAAILRFEESNEEHLNCEMKNEDTSSGGHTFITVVSDSENAEQFGSPAKRHCGDHRCRVLENRKLIKEILDRQQKMQITLDAILTALNNSAASAKTSVPLSTVNRSNYPNMNNLSTSISAASVTNNLQGIATSCTFTTLPLSLTSKYRQQMTHSSITTSSNNYRGMIQSFSAAYIPAVSTSSQGMTTSNNSEEMTKVSHSSSISAVSTSNADNSGTTQSTGSTSDSSQGITQTSDSPTMSAVVTSNDNQEIKPSSDPPSIPDKNNQGMNKPSDGPTISSHNSSQGMTQSSDSAAVFISNNQGMTPPSAVCTVPMAAGSNSFQGLIRWPFELTPVVVHSEIEGFIELGGKDIQPPLLFSLELYKRLLRSNRKPTLLTKALMGEIFTRAEMSVSNMGGKKGKEALDHRKITAICVQIDIQFSAAGIQLDAREIKNAINDKCRYMRFTTLYK